MREAKQRLRMCENKLTIEASCRPVKSVDPGRNMAGNGQRDTLAVFVKPCHSCRTALQSLFLSCYSLTHYSKRVCTFETKDAQIIFY